MRAQARSGDALFLIQKRKFIMKTIPTSALIIGIAGLVLTIFTRGFGGVCLLGMILIAWAGFAWWKSGDAAPRAGKPTPVDYRRLMEPLKLKQIGKYSAIALDTDNRILHLYENKQYRSYPFSEIRRWSCRICNGDVANIRGLRANREATGFFIEVRDIDFPRWKIEFPVKGLAQSHARWMEIFQQYVNEK